MRSGKGGGSPGEGEERLRRMGVVPCCKAMHTVSRCLRCVSPGPRNDVIAVESCYWGTVGVGATETGKVGARRQLKQPFSLSPLLSCPHPSSPTFPVAVTSP